MVSKNSVNPRVSIPGSVFGGDFLMKFLDEDERNWILEKCYKIT